MDFQKVAIIGGGLLGGSIALALMARFPALQVSLWSRREESVVEAQSRGIRGATSDLALSLKDADLVILCTPVGVMPSLVARMTGEGMLAPGCLVTDVGSVKGPVHRHLEAPLQAAGVAFIGSHPMAGSDQAGVLAADAELFEGAFCFLTVPRGADVSLVERLAAFWKALGCSSQVTSPEAHDALVARISHFPHAMAAATARVALADGGDARFGGGGLRDTTRVAGGDPEMWAEIFMENREALSVSLERCLTDMSEMLAMLRAGDHEAVRGWLAGAKSARDHVRPATIPSDFP